MRLHRKLLALSVLPLLSCSTASLEERYRSLPPDAQAAFLAHYPEAKAKKTEADPSDTGPDFKLLEHDPKTYTLTKLEIIPSIPNPVTQGSSLELKAILHYADGRAADATEDVRWSAAPELASFERNQLKFECAASNVVVTADFLNERHGAATIAFRKPLKTLELRVENSTLNLNRDEYLSLELLARCQDGTASVVTCESQWKSLTRGVDVTGCGRVHLPKKSPRKIRVRVSYGGLTVDRTLQTPLRD